MSDQLESMKEQYHRVMDEAKAMAFIKILNNHPDATLPDVAAFADGCGVGDLTLSQLFPGKRPASAKAWIKLLGKQKALPAPRKKKGSAVLNLRLGKDRDTYDAKILSFLEKAKDWRSAREVIADCGGNASQARGSLNRLIESGYVDFKGRTRGVRYRAK